MTQTVLTLLDWFLPIAYLALWTVHARTFRLPLDQDRPTWLERITGKIPLMIMLAIHAGYTILRGLAQQAWPLSNKAEFFSLLALSILAVWLFTQRDEEDAQTGIFFLGITATFQLFACALMIPIKDTTHPILHENPIYGVHVLFMVLGFAALAVGAIDAIMYILLARALKNREMGLVFQKLPPLIRIEETSKRATVTGIFLLGIGLSLGHIVALYGLDSVNPWDPKIVLTDLAWLAYIVGMITIKLKGLGGLRMGYLSLAAFIILMLTVAISSLYLPSFHSFPG